AVQVLRELDAVAENLVVGLDKALELLLSVHGLEKALELLSVGAGHFHSPFLALCGLTPVRNSASTWMRFEASCHFCGCRGIALLHFLLFRDRLQDLVSAHVLFHDSIMPRFSRKVRGGTHLKGWVCERGQGGRRGGMESRFRGLGRRGPF